MIDLQGEPIRELTVDPSRTHRPLRQPARAALRSLRSNEAPGSLCREIRDEGRVTIERSQSVASTT